MVDETLRQGECNACDDLFADIPSAPPLAPAAELPDDLARDWLDVGRGPGDYGAPTERATKS